MLKERKAIPDGVRVMVLRWSLTEPYAIGHVKSSQVKCDDWGYPTIPIYDIHFPWGVHESVPYHDALAIPDLKEAK